MLFAVISLLFLIPFIWMLFGSLRAVGELQRSRRRGASDADMLASLTWLPRGMWVLLFWLIAAAAVIVAAGILLFT